MIELKERVTNTDQRDRLQPDESLRPDEAVSSLNGRYALTYQSDGNLVLYRNRDGAPLWHSGTNGKPGAVCTMQSDGNLVVYDRAGKALWASGTPNNPGSRLVVQDDGNAIIYTTRSSTSPTAPQSGPRTPPRKTASNRVCPSSRVSHYRL
jgi:hypothetical protein